MSAELDLERLVAQWRGPLVGLLGARGRDRRAAEELAQDVFAEAWLGRARFRGDPTDERAVGAWLAGIARNLDRAARRARRATPLETDPVAPIRTEDDEGAAVRAAIARLPEAQAEVVRAFYLEETSIARVAALVGKSERAVEGLLRRARARLAELLAQVEATHGSR